MYPLRFAPILRRYIWGGHRLGTVLNKPIGQESCAESWEIVDHNEDQSVVVSGEFQGMPLTELIHTRGDDLLGPNTLRRITAESVPSQLRGRFPLLFKFLDASRNLSVQVHPDDAMGATLDSPDLGKTEAWYVMDAEPGAKIYAGLKPGVTQEQFREAVGQGTTESLLNSFEPVTGDCIFIRAGTMHAIGAGLLIAEIQQASDTTFRLFDWNRVDANGRPRDLHIDQGLRATDFELGPVSPKVPTPTNSPSTEILVECDKFQMRRTQMNDSDSAAVGGDRKFHFLAVTKGKITLEDHPTNLELNAGCTTLLPHALESRIVHATEESEFLDITPPD